ncbi:PTS sugar transporter subunit IIA [Desulforhabdus amnigena]|jgi:fructose-specific phosphotransferase system IIA component|uniref:PTS EIIA type-2 domain-containing protein n=1 Tax=Desulforhabdus amnigena TaxID=40218 RepID=A0A9W6CX45_9BACT|nr:PTS sugar transporter subunit IIA [Desulforhabdus amnigena]NLJ27368.1 PTS sugar transporter subunit IIA [Deltaproteobacteria bacterium]GLI34214.1 hypothetical protein DAMNIGENAA_16470 [Desulforhabdus amnigena]
MKIWERLQPDCIFLDAHLSDKDSVLRFVVDIFARKGAVRNANHLYEGMKMREEVMSTGIGDGIGIPHAPSTDAKDAAILLIRLAEPIDFDALDGLPVDVILAMVVPQNATALHLQVLAAISRLCHNPKFMESIREAENSETLREKIKCMEEEMAFQ